VKFTDGNEEGKTTRKKRESKKRIKDNEKVAIINPQKEDI